MDTFEYAYLCTVVFLGCRTEGPLQSLALLVCPRAVHGATYGKPTSSRSIRVRAYNILLTPKDNRNFVNMALYNTMPSYGSLLEGVEQCSRHILTGCW